MTDLYTTSRFAFRSWTWTCVVDFIFFLQLCTYSLTPLAPQDVPPQPQREAEGRKLKEAINSFLVRLPEEQE